MAAVTWMRSNGARLGEPQPAVGVNQAHRAIGQPGQVAGGVGEYLAVDVDRRHRADDVRQQSGVVAGAGANLQHAQPRPQLQVFEHLRHQRRLAGRADRDRRSRRGVLSRVVTARSA
ncbi:MAG: hypothetical protein U0736_26425 [Gemmataceae bacterium]